MQYKVFFLTASTDITVTYNAKQSFFKPAKKTSALSNIPGLIGTVELYYPEYLFPCGAITVVSLILSLNKGN